MFTPALRDRFGCVHSSMECCFTEVFSRLAALQLTRLIKYPQTYTATIMIRPHKLNLKMEDNPLFYEILNEHNAIMSEWNRLSHQLEDMKIPKLISPRFRRRLQSVGLGIQELQKQFLQWNGKADGLFTSPNYIFSEDEERELGFIHYSGLLQDIRNHLDNRMVMIVSNFNRVQDLYSSQVNFVIAISSFVLTFLGLIATIVSIRHCA
jgi:hypothetical protein